MILLFDQNISFKVVERLKDEFPNAQQVRDLGLENASDREIWNYAKVKGFVIVTFDSDFYDFSLIWGHPPKIIWMRSFNQTSSAVENILRKHKLDIVDFVLDSDLACLEVV